MSETIPLDKLRAEFGDRLIAPGGTDYDRARTLFMGGFDHHPAAIIRPANATEVTRVVTLARDTGLSLAVRGGGHSLAGHSGGDGIVLDLTGLDIDPHGHTAWAQTGLTAGAYTTAAAAHGLATGFGDTGSVGIGGLTLGGGVGFLSREYGLTIDDLLAAEIVTADGQLLHTDPDHHPDLFWALRGGGGNFGVATRFQFRLHDVNTITGGMLMLPATTETVAGFVAAAQAAPDELSTIASVMPAPPMPFVPEEHHGTMVILALLCHSGDPAEGEQAMAPFRSAGPLVDMVSAMPYPQMYHGGGPEEGSHPVLASRTQFRDSFDHRTAQTILEHLATSDAAMRSVQLRVLGGAIARIPDGTTAYPHRARQLMVNIAAFCDDPDERPHRQEWVDTLATALSEPGVDGSYVNFAAGELNGDTRAAYPGPCWDRLRAVKAQYDPDNLFRRNHNIPPAAAGHA